MEMAKVSGGDVGRGSFTAHPCGTRGQGPRGEAASLTAPAVQPGVQAVGE